MTKPYINRLQDEVKELNIEKAEALRGVLDLIMYLRSPKFNHGSDLDGYVNVQDVTYWLQSHVQRHLIPSERL